MANLDLLPGKVFEITLADGNVIKGKFGTWAAKRFADKKKLTLVQLLELSTSPDLTLDDVTLTILCAVEYWCRKNNVQFAFTDVEACEWIEELGGVGSELYVQLMNHASSELPSSEAKEGASEKKS